MLYNYNYVGCYVQERTNHCWTTVSWPSRRYQIGPLHGPSINSLRTGRKIDDLPIKTSENGEKWITMLFQYHINSTTGGPKFWHITQLLPFQRCHPSFACIEIFQPSQAALGLGLPGILLGKGSDAGSEWHCRFWKKMALLLLLLDWPFQEPKFEVPSIFI